MAMIHFYTLDANGYPVAVSDIGTWSAWRAQNDRDLAADRIENVWISTVFIGYDLDVGETERAADYRPALFQTMIVGGAFDLSKRRFRHRRAALRTHAAWVADVRFAGMLSVILPIDDVPSLREAAFAAWAADHLLHPWYVFKRFAKLGFADATDAAIFRLSPWAAANRSPDVEYY
jgi:hypothetical protein